MTRRILLGSILTLALAGAAQAQAQTAEAQPQAAPRGPGVIELRRQLNQSYADADYSAFLRAARQLHEMRPNNSEYMYQVVLGYALNGNRSGAYGMMLTMQQQGLAYDFDQNPDTEAVRDTEAYEYLAKLLQMQGDPMGLSEPLFQLPESILIPTSMAWDESRKLWLVGTASDGAVWSVDSDGAVESLVSATSLAGMWGVFGVQSDPARNRLWVTTAADPRFRGYDLTDKGRSALFEFELDTLKFVKRYPVPVDGRPHRLSQMALAPNGDLYMVDGILPIIYRLQSGADRISSFMASPRLVSLRGLAISDDGSKLYLADYEMGVLVIDLVGKAAYELEHDANLNLGGIEGLYYWQGHLVTIQNNISPQRIMRLQLDAQGLAVEQIAPIAIAQPIFDYPTYGALVGTELTFLASSHWGTEVSSFKPIQLARVEVENVPELESPEMMKYMQERAMRQEARDAGN